MDRAAGAIQDEVDDVMDSAQDALNKDRR